MKFNLLLYEIALYLKYSTNPSGFGITHLNANLNYKTTPKEKCPWTWQCFQTLAADYPGFLIRKNLPFLFILSSSVYLLTSGLASVFWAALRLSALPPHSSPAHTLAVCAQPPTRHPLLQANPHPQHLPCRSASSSTVSKLNQQVNYYPAFKMKRHVFISSLQERHVFTSSLLPPKSFVLVPNQSLEYWQRRATFRRDHSAKMAR